ncbi:hypothetical protein ABSA28_00612 [Candidatus Hepatincolaceae symbiont of Richtersius coronifer]
MEKSKKIYRLKKQLKVVNRVQEKISINVECYIDYCYKYYRLAIKAIARGTDEIILISSILPRFPTVNNTLNISVPLTYI